jgi:hypothetical protein
MNRLDRNGQTAARRLHLRGLRSQLHQIEKWRARGWFAIGNLRKPFDFLEHLNQFHCCCHVAFLAFPLQVMCQWIYAVSFGKNIF